MTPWVWEARGESGWMFVLEHRIPPLISKIRALGLLPKFLWGLWSWGDILAQSWGGFVSKHEHSAGAVLPVDVGTCLQTPKWGETPVP